MSDLDIDRIVEQAINETPTLPYQPGITSWERQTDYADKVARRAAELAVAKERERCAKIAETHRTTNNVIYGFQSGFVTAVGMIAAAIRAGKEVGI